MLLMTPVLGSAIFKSNWFTYLSVLLLNLQTPNWSQPDQRVGKPNSGPEIPEINNSLNRNVKWQKHDNGLDIVKQLSDHQTAKMKQRFPYILFNFLSA